MFQFMLVTFLAATTTTTTTNQPLERPDRPRRKSHPRRILPSIKNTVTTIIMSTRPNHEEDTGIIQKHEASSTCISSSHGRMPLTGSKMMAAQAAAAAKHNTQTLADASSWTVRPATVADRDACRHVLTQSYQQMLAPDYDADLLRQLVPMIAEPREELLRSGQWYVVELCNHQKNHPDRPTMKRTTTTTIVGCGGWSVRPPETKESTSNSSSSSSSSDSTLERHCPPEPQPHGEVLGVPHLRHFAVHPQYARQGVGKALWERTRQDIRVYYFHYYQQQQKNCLTAAAADREQAMAFPAIEVFSTRTAVPFYASLGFHVVQELDLELMPGTYLPSLLMSREPEPS